MQNETVNEIYMKNKWKVNEKYIYSYYIHRPRLRHGPKYTKYKTCFSMMMVICIKQRLSNIWSSIHEKVKQHWGWVGKECIAY